MGVRLAVLALASTVTGMAVFRFWPLKPPSVMPMTSPNLLTSAPPLLPWSVAALVWL